MTDVETHLHIVRMDVFVVQPVDGNNFNRTAVTRGPCVRQLFWLFFPRVFIGTAVFGFSLQMGRWCHGGVVIQQI